MSNCTDQELLEKIKAFSTAFDKGKNCDSLRAELKALGVGFNPSDGNIDFEYASEEFRARIVRALRKK